MFDGLPMLGRYCSLQCWREEVTDARTRFDVVRETKDDDDDDDKDDDDDDEQQTVVKKSTKPAAVVRGEEQGSGSDTEDMDDDALEDLLRGKGKGKYDEQSEE
jgi:hypothetical protein